MCRISREIHTQLETLDRHSNEKTHRDFFEFKIVHEECRYACYTVNYIAVVNIYKLK